MNAAQRLEPPRRAACRRPLAPVTLRPVLGEETPKVELRGVAQRLDDATLVAAVAGGDRDSLAALYDAHAPALLALARRILGDAGAEDVVHDVFLEVWHHAAEYSVARGTVVTWLSVRTRSRALDRLGRHTRHAVAVERIAGDDATTSSPPPPPPSLIDGARVRQHVTRLSPELAVVLELAYFEGLSSSEIADRIGTPVGTVKSRMARALATLRESMRPAAEGSGK